MTIVKMTELDLSSKRVLIRQDLNVPVKDGKVTSDARIKASLPTIKHALQAGAKVMVMSHLGRPTEGEYDDAFSMQPVVDYLKAELDCPVRIEKDYLSGLELEAGELCQLQSVVAWGPAGEAGVASWFALDISPHQILDAAGCA